MLKETDRLSRFIYFSDQINWITKKVKSSLFSKKHPRGFSVFETTDLDEESIKKIELRDARKGNENKKPPYGRCDMSVRNYKKGNLDIQEDMPPPRHYNILGMPVKNDLTDANNLNIRQEMANKYSKLIIYKQKT